MRSKRTARRSAQSWEADVAGLTLGRSETDGAEETLGVFDAGPMRQSPSHASTDANAVNTRHEVSRIAGRGTGRPRSNRVQNQRRRPNHGIGPAGTKPREGAVSGPETQD